MLRSGDACWQSIATFRATKTSSAWRSEAEARLGPVGVLMNNAGVVLRGALEHVELADWQWCLGINVFGVIRGIHAFLPRMIERRHGYIVNTGSVAGLVALTGEGAPYIASKFAVVGLTEALALYARPFGIGVSLLCPGGVQTNLAETGRSIGMTPERERAETRMAQAVQGGEELQPADVGDLVVQAITADQFLILPDEFHANLVRRRSQDLNAFLKFRFEALETLNESDTPPQTSGTRGRNSPTGKTLPPLGPLTPDEDNTPPEGTNTQKNTPPLGTTDTPPSPSGTRGGGAESIPLGFRAR